ncbi:hypothetical protein FSP39_024491 [Pinctada imbricata]|uniref:Alpha-(1,6)-fucosyltransferase n=1 Tax=Pinctada imbricata TaxID=66713 RepID=A0AA88Y1I6_PINIB|nr:hypothetical protein FSP39_024491 [Pinctada imbricata]
MIYMSNTAFQAPEGSSELERQLKRTVRELEKLKAQNDEFRALALDIRKLTKGREKPGDNDDVEGKGNGEEKQRVIDELQNKVDHMNDLLKEASYKGSEGEGQLSVSGGEPTMNHEVERRRVENTAMEFWFYLRNKLQKLKDKTGGKSDVGVEIDTIIQDSTAYQKTLYKDFWKLRTVDGLEKWRQKEADSLGKLVQARFHFLQNPSDCSTAKKIVCNLSKGCGYGCQLHHLVYCMMVGYALDRTLILESKGWRYAAAGWESVFRPLSDTCMERSGRESVHWGAPDRIKDVQVVEMPIIDSLHPRPDYLPLSIPKDISERLIRVNGDPSSWWIGQFVQYLTRPQPHLQKDLDRAQKKLGFSNPCVGVHVRRTDKLAAEAAYHSVDEYMRYVAEYFDKLEMIQEVPERKVFLASDDPSVLPEAKKNYPDYTFISDPSVTLSAGLNKRYTDESLRGVILDIHFLSLCDYLVCTFSSQVCRVAYEKMQTMHGDPSANFKSLDDIYYFGGQNGHYVEVVEEHVKRNSKEIDMEPGDLIGIAGNHWDGNSKGMNRRTGKTGLFPSYKTQNKLTIVDLPEYPEAKVDR